MMAIVGVLLYALAFLGIGYFILFLFSHHSNWDRPRRRGVSNITYPVPPKFKDFSYKGSISLKDFLDSSDFEEWYKLECGLAEKRMPPKEYLNYIKHKRYFQVGWNAALENLRNSDSSPDRLNALLDELESTAKSWRRSR